METTELLSKIPLFLELSPSDLESLAKQIERRHFQKDEVVLHQGEASGALFLVMTGEVEIYIAQKDGKHPLALTTLSEGQYFGELSLFDQQPHSASARTLVPSEILVLQRDPFLSYVRNHPNAAIGILAEMSQRIRQTNEALNQQVSRNVYDEIDENRTLTDRLADMIASFGGSWKFILSFLSFTVLWMVFNMGWLAFHPFDAYPYQFLNLVLAVVASLQAPIIMMSQNRQSSRDRLSAKVDFDVNRKNEFGIELLLKKMVTMEKTLRSQAGKLASKEV